jgi:CBS domain-containing protein
MARTVISVEPNATVLQAARQMLQHHISGLPVIDKAGSLVGILSEGDFLRRRETYIYLPPASPEPVVHSRIMGVIDYLNRIQEK